MIFFQKVKKDNDFGGIQKKFGGKQMMTHYYLAGGIDNSLSGSCRK